MQTAANDKYAVPGGCLVMLLILGFIVWTLAGCFKREPVRDYEADYTKATERLSSPSVYIAVSRFIERRGHACPTIREILPKHRLSPGLEGKGDVEMIVTCDSDGALTTYDVEMSRDNRRGTVEPHTEP